MLKMYHSVALMPQIGVNYNTKKIQRFINLSTGFRMLFVLQLRNRSHKHVAFQPGGRTLFVDSIYFSHQL